MPRPIMIHPLLVVLLAACSSPAPAPVGPSPPPTGSSDVPAEPTTAGLGETCGGSDVCATGQACVHYFGIAGPSGPEFTSCEISCKGDAPCPSGTKCITIADGPGQVCRP